MKRILSVFILLCLMMNMSAQTKHIIQRGETWSTLSKKYNVSIEEIKGANPNVSVPLTGTSITIPNISINNLVEEKTSSSTEVREEVHETVTQKKQMLDDMYIATGVSDKEQYRRSSLCLILLTHSDKKYADEMERIFKSFPLPARYNEHNISDLRVISVKGKQSKSDIDRLVRSNFVAQKIVGRWFN